MSGVHICIKRRNVVAAAPALYTVWDNESLPDIENARRS
jgi:hypothetical protein